MLKINRYNRTEAVNYALKYAKERNPKYHDYTNEGGNCTNYISQCLYAGAPVMNFFKNGWFYLFLISNDGIGVFGQVSPLEGCEAGDIIQLKFKNKPVFSHCLFVTKVISLKPKEIYVCANTRDVKAVPLSYYSFEQMRLIHILGYRT